MEVKKSKKCEVEYKVQFKGKETQVVVKNDDISYEVAADGYLIVKANGMTIRSAGKVSEETNLSALAIAMRAEAIESLDRAGKTLWITVYKDTVKTHDDNENLTGIKVLEAFAKQYFEECIKDSECEWKTYEEFVVNYTADDTEDFYEYAKKHNAILDIEYWQ